MISFCLMWLISEYFCKRLFLPYWWNLKRKKYIFCLKVFVCNTMRRGGTVRLLVSWLQLPNVTLVGLIMIKETICNTGGDIKSCVLVNRLTTFWMGNSSNHVFRGSEEVLSSRLKHCNSEPAISYTELKLTDSQDWLKF